MKLYLSIWFRAVRDEVLPLVPPALDFLRPLIRNYDEASWRPPSVSIARFEVESELGEQVIAWAQVEQQGKSIASTIRAHDRHELVDLEGHSVVELYPSILGPVRRAVQNFKSAYRATNACAYCHRLNWEQRVPLQISPSKRFDLEYTNTYEWIASPRVQGVLARYGVETRPVKEGGWGQIEFGAEVPVIPDPALVGSHTLCRYCDQRSYWRKDWVQGDVLDKTLTILTLYRHDPPLALSVETAAGVKLARGNMRFGVRTGGVDHPIYVVGTVVRDSIYRFEQEGEPCFFASTELVRELLELGVRNVSFRPVRLVDRVAAPCFPAEPTG